MEDYIANTLTAIVITALGTWLGFSLALKHERKKESANTKEEKRRVLSALLDSLERSSSHIEQMFTLHFPKGDYPTYPLDTQSLALIVHDTRRILPEGGRWPEKINGIRFEFEHINRKILMNYLAGTPIDGTSLSSDWTSYKTNGRQLPVHQHSFFGISYLLLSAKSALDDAIQDLRHHV